MKVVATQGKAAGKNYEIQQYERLKGKFKHFCPDWDMTAIDETVPEFESCCCNWIAKFKEQCKNVRQRIK